MPVVIDDEDADEEVADEDEVIAAEDEEFLDELLPLVDDELVPLEYDELLPPREDELLLSEDTDESGSSLPELDDEAVISLLLASVEQEENAAMAMEITAARMGLVLLIGAPLDQATLLI